MNYKEQLKSPKWQKKRLDVLNLRGFKCENCANEEKQLHVHHRFYLKGRKAWEYDNDVLQVLCETCHENEHKPKKENNMHSEIIEFIDSLDEDKFYNFFKIVRYLKYDNNEISSIEKIINNQHDSWSDSYITFSKFYILIQEFYRNDKYSDYLNSFIAYVSRGELHELFSLIKKNEEIDSLYDQIAELRKILDNKDSNCEFPYLENLMKKSKDDKEEFNLF